MVLERHCSFYRKSETLNVGRGIGYWDLDGIQTLCNEDMHSCEKTRYAKNIFFGPKEEEGMAEEKKCPLFRQPDSLSFGKGIGYCDIDSHRTACGGDATFCEKPDALKQYLRRKLSEFEKKENKGE